MNNLQNTVIIRRHRMSKSVISVISAIDKSGQNMGSGEGNK